MPILYALDQANKDNFSTISSNGASNKYMFNELFYRRQWDPTVRDKINLFYEINKEFKPTNDGGVTGIFTLQYKNTKDHPNDKYPQDKVISTVATVSCKLDDYGTQVVWKTSDGKWMKSKLLRQLEADLVGFKNNARDFVIASPTTHRAMHFRINRDPESVSIDLNRTSRTLTVYIAFNDPPQNFRNVRAEVTINPIEYVEFDFNSMPENVDEYYNGKELSTEQFNNMDEGFDINKFKLYMGGDEKSYSGRAFISEYKSTHLDFLSSNPFLILHPNNTLDGYPHMGETYNLSVHVRCDITDPNKESFAMGWGTDPAYMLVRGTNVKDYDWFTLSIKGEEYNFIYKLFIQTLQGASKCFVDKIRFIPIKAAEIPYVPPKIQQFTFNPNLPPMEPIDLYQLYSKPAPQTPTPSIQPPPPIQPTKTATTLYPESSQTEVPTQPTYTQAPTMPVNPTFNPDTPVNPTFNPDTPVNPTFNPDTPVNPTVNPDKPVNPEGGDSALSGGTDGSGSNAGVIVAVVIVVLAVVAVVGFIVYKKFFANNNAESSDVIESPLV